MPIIIRDLPFYDRPTSVQVRGRSVVVRRDQIIVWVSLSEIGRRKLDPKTARFPAILDTGCNHSFVLREQHLVEWAGIHPDFLHRFGPMRLYGMAMPQLAQLFGCTRIDLGCATSFHVASRICWRSTKGLLSCRNPQDTRVAGAANPPP